ncbi:hypothetical protein ACOSQ4_004238 [Xanthoceras sorbifolium]
MAERDVVSWNALLSTFVEMGIIELASELFDEMEDTKVMPDNCTLVNISSACARIGALSQGEWVHAYIDKNGFGIDGFRATALVDMYSKCGNIEKDTSVFRSTLRKDISTWNSIISGLSTHGYGEQALQIWCFELCC